MIARAKPILPLLAILVLAASLRVVSISMPRRDFLANDGWDYRDISRNLAEGNGYARSTYRAWYEPKPPGAPDLHPDLHRPPLLPLVGAPLWLLPGDWNDWAKGVSVVLGVLAVAGVYAVASPLFGPLTARVAALLFAIYPYAIHRASRWSTETLMAAVLLGGVACAIRYRQRGQPRWLAGAGLLLGLTALARPNGLLLALGLGAWLVLRKGPIPRPRALGIYSAALVVVLAPWAIRNAHHTGVPNPSTFFGPYNMWRGTNDSVYELYRGPEPEAHAALVTELNRASHAHVDTLAARGLYEPREMNRYWLETVRRYAWAHPERVAFIHAARAVHVVRPWLDHDPRTRSDYFYLALAGFLPTTLLAIWALARVRPARDAFLCGPIVLGLLGSLPFTFVTRLRFPFYDPFVVILAAAGLLALYTRVRQISRR